MSRSSSKGSKKNLADASQNEARKTIAADLQAFLAAGKAIEEIPSGVSGQDPLVRRKHIVIGRGRKAAAT